MKNIEMRYLIEPGDKIYLKGYGYYRLLKTWARI